MLPLSAACSSGGGGLRSPAAAAEQARLIRLRQQLHAERREQLGDSIDDEDDDDAEGAATVLEEAPAEEAAGRQLANMCHGVAWDERLARDGVVYDYECGMWLLWFLRTSFWLKQLQALEELARLRIVADEQESWRAAVAAPAVAAVLGPRGGTATREALDVCETLDALSDPLFGLILEVRGVVLFAVRAEELCAREMLLERLASEITAREDLRSQQDTERVCCEAVEALERDLLAVCRAEDAARMSACAAGEAFSRCYLLQWSDFQLQRISLSTEEAAARYSRVGEPELFSRQIVELIAAEDAERVWLQTTDRHFQTEFLHEFRREDAERISIAFSEAIDLTDIFATEQFEAERLVRTEVDRQLQHEVSEVKRKRQQITAVQDAWRRRAVECERSGQFAEAATNWRFITDLLATTGDEPRASVELALARVCLAKALEAAGSVAEAHEQCLAALPALEAHMGGMSLDLAVLLQMIATQCRRLSPAAGSSQPDADDCSPRNATASSPQQQLAISSLVRCIAIRKELTPDSMELAAVHSQLSNAYRALGEMEQAKEQLFCCLEIQRQHTDEFNESTLVELATSHTNLAVLYANSGDFHAAVSQLRSGLAIRDSVCPGDSATAAAYTTAASLLRKCNDQEGALEMLHRALAIRIGRSAGASTDDAASAAHSLETANIYRSIGKTQVVLKRLSEARASYGAAIDALDVAAPSSLELADSLYSVGKVSFALGDLKAALQQFNRCLALQQKLGVAPENIQFTQKKIRQVFQAQKAADGGGGGGGAASAVRERLTEAM
jgi:tetratricopeptide (TPR) repeat protein